MKTVDWTKWSAVAEILGAIAIVVTLLYLADQTHYLALQTEQNNELLRAQANYNVLQNRTAIYIPVLLQDDLLAKLLAKYARGEELEDYEVLQIDTFRRWHLTNWEWEYRESVAGRLLGDDLPVYAWREAMHAGIPSDFGLLEYWEQNKQDYSAAFRDFIDQNVVQPGFP